MHSPEPVRSYTTHRPPGVHFSDSADAPDDPTLTAPYTLAAPPDDAEAPDDLAAPDAPDAPDAPPCYGGERCRPRLGPARCDLCRNLGEALTGHIRGH